MAITGTKQAERNFLSPECSHDVNELSVSLTSYANFLVKGFFSVTVVKEMQVLLTTHKSTNFYNLLFLLIPDLGSGAESQGLAKHAPA